MAIKKASRRKSRASESPSKDKAPLAACGPAKLRATVISDRLHCKQLEERLQTLEKKIEAEGIHLDEAIDKNVLQIISGQNLDATPHMKFFWEQHIITHIIFYKMFSLPRIGAQMHKWLPVIKL